MNDRQERAAEPEDLARLFVERANAGDADGLAALYEPDAVLAFPPGQVTEGRAAIRAIYEQLIARASPSSSRRRCPRSGRAISRLPPPTDATARESVSRSRDDRRKAGCASSIGPSRPSPSRERLAAASALTPAAINGTRPQDIRGRSHDERRDERAPLARPHQDGYARMLLSQTPSARTARRGHLDL